MIDITAVLLVVLTFGCLVMWLNLRRLEEVVKLNSLYDLRTQMMINKYLISKISTSNQILIGLLKNIKETDEDDSVDDLTEDTIPPDGVYTVKQVIKVLDNATIGLDDMYDNMNKYYEYSNSKLVEMGIESSVNVKKPCK